MKLSYTVHPDIFKVDAVSGNRNNFSFRIENTNDSHLSVLDIEILGIALEIDYTEMVGDVIVTRHDKTKDIYKLPDVIQENRCIEFYEKNIFPFDLKSPFTKAFIQIKLVSKEKASDKEIIQSLQKDRQVYNHSVEVENSISVVGMKHVGSTMVFNMIRIAYKLLGKKVNDGNLTQCQDKFDVYVTKSHSVEHYFDRADDSMEIKRHVTVIRDIRDSSISGFMRFHLNQSMNKNLDLKKEIVKYGLNVFINSMIENIMLYEKSLVTDPYVFVYETYKKNKKKEATKLFEFLQIKIPDGQFMDKVIDITENYVHNEHLPIDLKDYQTRIQSLDYLLTKDHNTSNGRTEKWRQVFTPEQNDVMLEEPLIRDYLREHGYSLK